MTRMAELQNANRRLRRKNTKEWFKDKIIQETTGKYVVKASKRKIVDIDAIHNHWN